MKKKLEAELISIAHRILKLKNKSEIIQLHQETQKLYEKLSVLRFLEENFADVKPTIGRAEAEDILDKAYQEPEAAQVEEVNPEKEIAAVEEEKPIEVIFEQEDLPAPEPEEETIPIAETMQEKEVDEVIAEVEEEMSAESGAANEDEDVSSIEEPETAEEIENETEPEVAEANEIDSPKSTEPEPKTNENDLFKPVFEWAYDNKTEEAALDSKGEPDDQEARHTNKSIAAPESGQIAFDDLLGKGYTDPVFVKPEDLARERAAPMAQQKEEEKKNDVIPVSPSIENIPQYKPSSEIADKTVSLNDRLSKGITVGLNDRIAFVKNLFGNSNEDYNRVLSQLITFSTLEEAQEFIDNMVKPDYNNWAGKDEYAQRFMEVIEKKFN